MKRRPRNASFSTIARMFPKTRTRAWEQSVNTIELRRARRNPGFSSTDEKFARPTKWYPVDPTFTSPTAYRNASRNGTPTRAST